MPASGYWELRFPKPRLKNLNTIVWKLGGPVLQCKEQNRIFSIEKISPIKRLLFEILLEEMKSVVNEDEFECLEQISMVSLIGLSGL